MPEYLVDLPESYELVSLERRWISHKVGKGWRVQVRAEGISGSGYGTTIGEATANAILNVSEEQVLAVKRKEYVKQQAEQHAAEQEALNDLTLEDLL